MAGEVQVYSELVWSGRRRPEPYEEDVTSGKTARLMDGVGWPSRP
jgi:hypothetical protein